MSYCIDGNPLQESACTISDGKEVYGKRSGAKVMRSDGGDFVRQPCKARGITIKSGQTPHTAKFAYIDIPMGSLHGAELSCSHPVCIASSRRFQYCAHCDAPVAKRNFNVRHAHGNLNSPPNPHLWPRNVSVSQFDGDVDLARRDGYEGHEIPIPSVISINDNQDATCLTDDKSCLGVPLSDEEYAIIKLLRSRPANDYGPQLNQWAEMLHRQVSKEGEGACGEVEERCSSRNENHDDNDAALLFVDGDGDVDFSSLFEV